MNLLRSVSLGAALAVAYGLAAYMLAAWLGLAFWWAIAFVVGAFVLLAFVGPLLVHLYVAAYLSRLADHEVYGDTTNYER